MAQDRNTKIWHPARFTHGGIHESGDGPFGPADIKQHIVVILNTPLENKDLLVDACLEGMHHTKTRGSESVANVVNQLVASCVLMAGQTDSTICILMGRKKQFVFVIRVFVSCKIVDRSSRYPTPYVEIWTPCVLTWRSTIGDKT